MENKTPEGWTNYATFRVFTDYFQSFHPEQVQEILEAKDNLQAELKDVAIADVVEPVSLDRLDPAESWLRAFLDQVNWEEIAERFPKLAEMF